MTKVTSTTTALVEEESDGDGIPNAREVIAGAQERLGQAGTQLQNAAPLQGLPADSQQVHGCLRGADRRQDRPPEPQVWTTFIKGSALEMMRVVCQRISHRWMKMTVCCRNKLTLPLQNKKVQKKQLTWICPVRHSP